MSPAESIDLATLHAKALRDLAGSVLEKLNRRKVNEAAELLPDLRRKVELVAGLTGQLIGLSPELLTGVNNKKARG